MKKLLKRSGLILGLVAYMMFVFMPAAHAYIDPSATTYLIQAIAGIVIALLLRFASHFISGVYVFASTGKIWDDLDFIAENKYIYSLVYNGAYMVPEIILTVLVTVILFKIPQIRKILTSADSAEEK